MDGDLHTLGELVLGKVIPGAWCARRERVAAGQSSVDGRAVPAHSSCRATELWDSRSALVLQ